MAKWTLILVAIAALCAGCSRPVPPANNKANTPANKPAAPKKSYQSEYTQEMNAAFAAWDRYGKSKSNEDYIETGVRLYTGMKFKVLHDKENGNVSGFPKVTEFGVLFMDWKKTTGPSDDARVKAARDEWSKAAEK
jgi:hypothetical protein